MTSAKLTMSDLAIRVENLSKRYRIGTRERYKTLRESLAGAFIAPFRYFRRNSQSEIRNSQFEVPTPFRRLEAISKFEIRHLGVYWVKAVSCATMAARNSKATWHMPAVSNTSPPLNLTIINQPCASSRLNPWLSVE